MKKHNYKKTQTAYAKAFGVSPRTIRTWQEKNYPLDDPHAMGKMLDAQKNVPAGVEPTEFRKMRLRKVRLECEKLENALAIQKKEFVPAAQVYEDGLRIGALMSAELDGLLSDMPGALAGLDELRIRERLSVRLKAITASIKRQLAAVVR